MNDYQYIALYALLPVSLWAMRFYHVRAIGIAVFIYTFLNTSFGVWLLSRIGVHDDNGFIVAYGDLGISAIFLFLSKYTRAPLPVIVRMIFIHMIFIFVNSKMNMAVYKQEANWFYSNYVIIIAALNYIECAIILHACYSKDRSNPISSPYTDKIHQQVSRSRDYLSGRIRGTIPK